MLNWAMEADIVPDVYRPPKDWLRSEFCGQIAEGKIFREWSKGEGWECRCYLETLWAVCGDRRKQLKRVMLIDPWLT